MKTRYVGMAGLLLTFVLNVPSFGQNSAEELLAINTLVSEFLNESTIALETVKSVEEKLKDIELGKEPSGEVGNWRELANKFEEAANKIKNAPLPTQFDQSQFQISYDQVKNCNTRESALLKSKAYLIRLKEAESRGNSTIKELDQRLAALRDLKNRLAYFLEVYPKVKDLPVFVKFLEWDWVDLDNLVTRSVGVMRRALEQQRDRISTEVGKINLYIPNLSSNIGGIESLACFDGTWSGTWTRTFSTQGGRRQNVLNTPIKILIQNVNGQFSGTFIMNNISYSLTDFVINGSSISFIGTNNQSRVECSMSVTNANKNLTGSIRIGNNAGVTHSTAFLTRN